MSPTYASDYRGAACNTTFAPQGGMSLRDWFAGQALAGLTPAATEHDWTLKELADHTYRLADAMLEARKGGDS